MITNTDIADVFNLIKNLSLADSEATARRLTNSVVQQAGGEHFIYSTLRADKCTQHYDVLHYFENCPSAWRQLYDSRKWYMNDPIVEYAKLHTEVIVSSQVECKTKGQSDLLKSAAFHGFRSGIIVPTHCSLGGHEWLGILFMGSSSDPLHGEPLFLSNRLAIRALAMELMDWWKNRFKNDAIDKYKLQDDEIRILQHLKNGKRVAEISAIMDLKTTHLYQSIDVLKVKLNTLKTGEAIHKAKTYGLLG